MPTTISWGGNSGQSVTVNHPRELLNWGHPTPPRQPIASWATTLAQFEALCTASQFADAIKWCHTEYCLAGITDVPSGARTAFKAWCQANLRAKPECFTGPGSDWRTDGREFS